MVKTKLYELRVQKDIRQEEMADLVGVGQATYSRKERGITDVTMEEWILMAKILEVKVEDIYRPNSRTVTTSRKTTNKLTNLPLYIVNQIDQLKKENAALKEELKNLKNKIFENKKRN